MAVRIYRPAKTATQSGRAKTRKWVIEFEMAAARRIDPLMGWTSSDDTRQQVSLSFDSQADAIAFAKRNGWSYELVEAEARRVKPKSYADNFRYDRGG